MEVISLGKESIEVLKRFKKFTEDREEELTEYFNILLDLKDIIIRIDPRRLMILLADYPKRFLQVVRMKAGAVSKLLTWEKEYELWYADKYLDAIKTLEGAGKGETTDTKKGTTKSTTGRVLKGHIESYIKCHYFEEMQYFLNTINEIKMQKELLEDIVRIFKDMTQAFKALADLREIWKPFMSIEAFKGTSPIEDHNSPTSQL